MRFSKDNNILHCQFQNLKSALTIPITIPKCLKSSSYKINLLLECLGIYTFTLNRVGLFTWSLLYVLTPYFKQEEEMQTQWHCCSFSQKRHLCRESTKGISYQFAVSSLYNGPLAHHYTHNSSNIKYILLLSRCAYLENEDHVFSAVSVLCSASFHSWWVTLCQISSTVLERGKIIECTYVKSLFILLCVLIQ